MKKELVVKWSTVDHSGYYNKRMSGAHIMFTEPQLLLKEVGKEFSHHMFWKCPAVTAMCTNTFVIRAPIDITLHYKEHDGGFSFHTPDVGQSVVDAFFLIREDGTMSLPPKYVMYCDEPLMMEVIPTPILTAPLHNMALISGTYDVGKWIRPIEFAFRPIDFGEPVVIKQGEPLFCVRFLPRNGETIKLVREPLTQEIEVAMHACANVKALTRKTTPLATLYRLGESFLATVRKSKHGAGESA